MIDSIKKDIADIKKQLDNLSRLLDDPENAEEVFDILDLIKVKILKVHSIIHWNPDNLDDLPGVFDE